MKTNPTEALSTVALVKAEFGPGIDTSKPDSDIEEFITDLSQDWLQRCGVFSLSTLYDVTETYDGSGTHRLKTRQVPINSVAKLTIWTRVIPESTGPTVVGWGIEDNQNFIFLRGCRFPRGTQNIQVTYEAGADGVPGDVQRAFTRHCALEFKRKDSINLKSVSLASGGTTTYLSNDELPPDILRVIRNHSRIGM
jgi:hypothetical protein